MTQEQALKAFQEIFPQQAASLSVQRERTIGYKHGWPNVYTLWDHSRSRIQSALVASSNRSWEHALAIAKSGDEDVWPEEKGQWEDEQVSA